MNQIDMGISPKSTFALHVVWHARYSEGEALAGWLHDHFEADLFRNATAGARVQVSYRTLSGDGLGFEPVDWDRADTTAVVVLLNCDLVQDSKSASYIRELSRNAEHAGFNGGLFPVVIDGSLPSDGLKEQAIRWDKWNLADQPRRERLVRDLTHEFIRMLKRRLSETSAADSEDHLSKYLEKVNVFLSHSKHDEDGEVIATQIRSWIHENTSLASLIDTHDFPPSLPFESVITHLIQNNVLLAIRTDSYSSREWCCREVLQAKQNGVPMIVVDCLQTQESRTFPYLGNVPTVRMTPGDTERIANVIGCLLDEIFMHYLWLCRTRALRRVNPLTLFLPRAPELASLSRLSRQGKQGRTSIVYPDPPVMSDEVQLFGMIRTDVTLRSFTQWEGRLSS